jgi:hypothetical protein
MRNLTILSLGALFVMSACTAQMPAQPTTPVSNVATADSVQIATSAQGFQTEAVRGDDRRTDKSAPAAKPPAKTDRPTAGRDSKPPAKPPAKTDRPTAGHDTKPPVKPEPKTDRPKAGQGTKPQAPPPRPEPRRDGGTAQGNSDSGKGTDNRH